MKTILCFGEALWDCLPEGRFPGGAPLNVAFHLNQLGSRAFPVSAVGQDDLGRELLARIQQWGVETHFVASHPALPTGTVTVALDSHRNAHYTINEGVAWDDLTVTPALLGMAAQADAIIYGSLAQRSAHNRHELSTLLAHSPQALHVCDVNLRPPYDNPERVWELASQADLVKLNDTELAKLLDEDLHHHSLESLSRQLADELGVDSLCVTAGARGAGLLHKQEWHWVDAEPVTVADTVGAGDAFLAALVFRLLEPDALPWECLRHACRLGEFVASHHGATPLHPPFAS